MEFLRLMGVGADGGALILVGTEGKQFRLLVDDALRTAVRNARILPPAAHASSLALPPREIQARLRAGASAETVAQNAGIPVEKVRRYETPILAERAHVASLAQQALVRRPATGTTGTGARTLLEILTEVIAAHGYHSDSLQWDAWRREDGRWTVQVGMPHAPDTTCTWTFEPPTRAVSPQNQAAREVLAEHHSPVSVPVALGNVHELALVRPAPIPNHASSRDTVLDLRPYDPAPTEPEVSDAAEPETQPVATAAASRSNSSSSNTSGTNAGTTRASNTSSTRRAGKTGTVGKTRTASKASRTASPKATRSTSSKRATAATSVELPESAAVGENTPRPRSTPSRSRARVPAWDDILFGGSN